MRKIFLLKKYNFKGAYFDVQKERVIEENKEIDENAAHVHLNISEKGHHVWEMIQHKHLKLRFLNIYPKS